MRKKVLRVSGIIAITICFLIIIGVIIVAIVKPIGINTALYGTIGASISAFIFSGGFLLWLKGIE